MSASADAFTVATQHLQGGRRREAEEVLRRLLQSEPAHGPALHLLGSLAYDDGRAEAAVACFRQAVTAQPQNAAYLSCLGAALLGLGQPAEAEACHRRALALLPDDGLVLNNLGIALAARGANREAIEVFRRAQAAGPPDAGVLCNLAAVLHREQQLDEGAVLLQEALRLCPGLAQVHNNLGNVLRDLGKLDQAEGCFRQALHLQPRLALAHRNLADLLHRRGRLDEAVRTYAQCLQLSPADAEAHNRLGLVFLDQNRCADAIACFRRALQLRPEDAEGHNNLGNANNAEGNLDEAVSCYRKALQLRPDWPIPCYNLGVTLQSQGKLAEARACFRQAMQANPEDHLAHSTYVGSLHFDPEVMPAQLLAEHQLWAARHAHGLADEVAHANVPDPDRRLRVGYVSPDFRAHAVAFFLEPLLAQHDPNQVETFCYAKVPAPDARTTQLRGLAAHWCNTVGLSDEELAAQVRQDGIDLLIDLTGHLAHNHLLVFARRPAPVQLTYLGYPGTTGVPGISYRLTDPIADPPGEQVAHSEDLVRLSPVFCCYAPPLDVPQQTALPCEQQRVVTFGSLHKLEKLNGPLLDLWARLLQAVPGSRLLLARHTLHGATASWWLEQFTQRGVPTEKVHLQRLEPVGLQHLRAYDGIDIALDVFPWNGHTTACEALWMGVPVVTLRGKRHAGRMTASVLSCLGLGSLIAESPEDYLRLAVGLAKDVAQRAELRAGLRLRMLESPLCDAAGFTRGLEAAYRYVWQDWCRHPSPSRPRL